MRIDPTMTQKEETFQVILDLIKASPCYNAFLITADVPEINMQQFWFTVKKIKKTTSYEFDLADNKYKVDVELFRKILSICPGVPNEEFIVPPSKESLINFLYEMGYKGQINKLASEYFQEYGRAIPDTMLTDEIKHSEEEQLVADTKKAIKASKEARKHLDYNNKQETEVKELVLDEGKGSSATKADTEIDWGSEDEKEKGNEDDDDRSIDIEENDDERTDLENRDQAMTDAEKLEEEKGDEEEEQANDDQAQEDQVEDDIVGTFVTMSQKEKPKSFLYRQLLQPITITITTQITITTPLPTLRITITTQTVTSPLPATEASDASGPLSEALNAILQRVSTLKKDVKELKKVDHTIVIVESIRFQVPPTVNEFLRSSLGDSLQKVLHKHTEELKQEFKQQESRNML
ncbi:hypothetical protein Tco_1186354 [Tanacetum coccineum]